MTETEICGRLGRAPDTSRAEALPKASATFAGACLLLHIALVFAAGSGMLSMSLPMLGLAALCGGCAVGAWRRRCSDRELGLTALIAGAMVSLHLIVMSSHASQAICGSIADSPVLGSMPGMSGAGGGANAVSALAELIMQAGVAFAGIAGLIAMGALAQRRLAPGRRLPLRW